MKLRFLGQVYSQLQQNVLTIASKNTACFRGKKYNLRVPVENEQRSPESQMSVVVYKYRGVSYVVEHYQSPTKEKTLIRC